MYVKCDVRKNPFSSVFAITDRRDIGLYDVPMLMSLFGLGIGIMFASFQSEEFVVVYCRVVDVCKVL